MFINSGAGAGAGAGIKLSYEACIFVKKSFLTHKNGTGVCKMDVLYIGMSFGLMLLVK